jgi:membrane-bound metal-dependent hydrolase YbcI (DUF457 family)
MSGLGHLAPALALKSAAPGVPLWTLVAASELDEILYFAFTLAGVENAAEVTYDLQNSATYLSQSVNPWSHGLVMSLVWSAAATLAARLVFRGWKPAAAVGLAVLSHWLLDFLMHSNLPLFLEGSPRLGLGLENTGAGFLFMTGLDLALLAGSLILYFKSRRRKAVVIQPS